MFSNWILNNHHLKKRFDWGYCFQDFIGSGDNRTVGYHHTKNNLKFQFKLHISKVLYKLSQNHTKAVRSKCVVPRIEVLKVFGNWWSFWKVKQSITAEERNLGAIAQSFLGSFLHNICSKRFWCDVEGINLIFSKFCWFFSLLPPT